MKKAYFFLVLVTVFTFGFSQSTIVTIDRANIAGPTTTGNDPTISSSGLVRGSGINLAAAGAANFTSNQWNATTQAGAATNNEYIEWSASASASNTVEITEIDIRNRRNANGPTNWQIFYSLDNFTTAGIAATALQTTAATATNYNFNGLSIISGTAGTITFRLYAWNSTTGGGWFRIAGAGAWSDYGITNPGIRLTGTITTTAVNDTESNIVTTGFDPTDNIDYASYTAPTGLTTLNAIKIGEFNIQDGGDDLTDTDLLGTILTDLGFDINGFSNLEAIALFDGIVNVGETTVTSSTTILNNLNSGLGVLCTDNSTKTIEVYATFKIDAVDNEQIQLTINSAQADVTMGSSFDFFDAGGAETPVLGDDNRIEVTATELSFNQEVSDTNQFELMLPYPSISAVDTNDNIDLDFASSITLTTTGTFDGSATTSETAIAGERTFNNLVFSAKDTALTITAASAGITSATSTTFNVNGPLITIALQDFDGATPEWTYTNDIPFFDNGWGTDGYYGIIDIAAAAPIDNPQFSDNILGDNDLNDEGNGTTGWATITFASIDVSAYDNIKVKFDWDIQGYRNNSNDAQYRLIYDGTNQAQVFLHDGNGAPESGEGHVSVDVPGSVDTVALEIRVRNNRLAGYSGFDNFRIVSEFDGLLYTGGTWTPNAPSDTTVTDNALVLDGTYTVTALDIEINNLTVSAGATTLIEKTSSLVVNGNLINKGTFQLDSDSNEFSSLIVEGTSTDDIVYMRHVNDTAAPGESDANDLIAPPVSGEAFDDFRGNNSNILSNGTGTLFLFGPFDKVSGSYVLYTDTETATLDAGNGYRAASTDADKFTFTGTVNTATINKTISVETGAASQEWNLIGNPYPSYIKLADFLSINIAEFDTPTAGVYGYDGDASDGWIIWNQAYSDANPNAVITPGQGFLVSSKAGGGTVSFTPTMRAIGSTDDFIAGRSSQTLDNGFVTLELTDNTSQNYNTTVYFNPNATLALDTGYDAAIFDNVAPNFAIYSHLAENNTGKDMATQAVSFDDLNAVTIPLGLNVAQGEQVTVSITDLNIPEDTEVYLEDNVANTFTDLKAGDLTFTANTTLTETGRFYLHFSRTQLNVLENKLNGLEIYTSTSPKAIIIKGQLESQTTLQLFDLQGRLVNTTTLNTKDTKHSVAVSNLSAGVYVLQLQNNSGNRTKKVILR